MGSTCSYSSSVLPPVRPFFPNGSDFLLALFLSRPPLPENSPWIDDEASSARRPFQPASGGSPPARPDLASDTRTAIFDRAAFHAAAHSLRYYTSSFNPTCVFHYHLDYHSPFFVRPRCTQHTWPRVVVPCLVCLIPFAAPRAGPISSPGTAPSPLLRQPSSDAQRRYSHDITVCPFLRTGVS